MTFDSLENNNNNNKTNENDDDDMMIASVDKPKWKQKFAKDSMSSNSSSTACCHNCLTNEVSLNKPDNFDKEMKTCRKSKRKHVNNDRSMLRRRSTEGNLFLTESKEKKEEEEQIVTDDDAVPAFVAERNAKDAALIDTTTMMNQSRNNNKNDVGECIVSNCCPSSSFCINDNHVNDAKLDHQQCEKRDDEDDEEEEEDVMKIGNDTAMSSTMKLTQEQHCKRPSCCPFC